MTLSHLKQALLSATAALTLAAAAPSASAKEEVKSAEQFSVQTTLLHNGKQFAKPTLLVNNAVPAMITLSGENGFELTLTVTSLGEDKVQLASKLNSAHGNVAPAQLSMQVGKLTAIAVDGMELRFTVLAAAAKAP